MDNFMDRLSKRFNAGEMIQANREAEARETERLRKQMTEYENILQEIRRLFFKTAEMSEQVSQLLAGGIEQFESYAQDANRLEEIRQLLLTSHDEADEKLEGKLEEIRQLLLAKQDEAGEKLENGLEEIRQILRTPQDTADEKLESRLEEIRQILLTLQDATDEKLESRLEEIKQILLTPQDTADEKLESRLEEIRQILLTPQDATDEKLESRLEEIKQILLTPQDETDEELENKLTGISLKIDNNESSVKREISDASYRLDASISQLSEEISLNRHAMDAQVSALQQSITEALSDGAGSEKMTAQLTEAIEECVKSQEHSAQQIKEMIVSLRLYQDDVQKHIEDYVHKEDVKVYRNVQANLSDQLTNRFRDMADRMDSLEDEVQKSRKTSPLLILTLLLSAAGVVLQALRMLGIV